MHNLPAAIDQPRRPPGARPEKVSVRVAGILEGHDRSFMELVLCCLNFRQDMFRAAGLIALRAIEVQNIDRPPVSGEPLDGVALDHVNRLAEICDRPPRQLTMLPVVIYRDQLALATRGEHAQKQGAETVALEIFLGPD